MTTQHEKTLAIAKDMYSERNVDISCGNTSTGEVNTVIHFTGGKAIAFNPFTNAEDSQAVQQAYRIDVFAQPGGFSAEHTVGAIISEYSHKDLKTAIAECAYQVVMSKGK